MADQDENVLINGTDFEVTTSIDTVNPDSIFKEVFVKNCVDAGRVATGTAMSNKTVQALMEPQSRPDRERHSIMCRTIMLHAFKICKPFRSMQEHEAVWFDGIVDILSKVVFFGELRSAHVQGKTVLRAVLDRLEPIYGIIHEIKHEHCRKIEEHYTRNAISAFIEFYQHANLTWRTWHGMRRTRTGVSIYKDTIDGVKVPVTMASVYYISKGIRAIKPLLPQYEQINCNQTIIMYTERDYSKSLNQLMTHYGEKEFEWETIDASISEELFALHPQTTVVNQIQHCNGRVVIRTRKLKLVVFCDSKKVSPFASVPSRRYLTVVVAFPWIFRDNRTMSRSMENYWIIFAAEMEETKEQIAQYIGEYVFRKQLNIFIERLFLWEKTDGTFEFLTLTVVLCNDHKMTRLMLGDAQNIGTNVNRACIFDNHVFETNEIGHPFTYGTNYPNAITKAIPLANILPDYGTHGCAAVARALHSELYTKCFEHDTRVLTTKLKDHVIFRFFERSGNLRNLPSVGGDHLRQFVDIASQERTTLHDAMLVEKATEICVHLSNGNNIAVIGSTTLASFQRIVNALKINVDLVQSPKNRTSTMMCYTAVLLLRIYPYFAVVLDKDLVQLFGRQLVIQQWKGDYNKWVLEYYDEIYQICMNDWPSFKNKIYRLLGRHVPEKMKCGFMPGDINCEMMESILRFCSQQLHCTNGNVGEAYNPQAVSQEMTNDNTTETSTKPHRIKEGSHRIQQVLETFDRMTYAERHVPKKTARYSQTFSRLRQLERNIGLLPGDCQQQFVIPDLTKLLFVRRVLMTRFPSCAHLQQEPKNIQDGLSQLTRGNYLSQSLSELLDVKTMYARGMSQSATPTPDQLSEVTESHSQGMTDIESDEDEIMGDNHSELTQMIDEELEELLDL